jgi:hypothetical protein
MKTKRRKRRKRQPLDILQRKARVGFRGHPVATIAYYGPDNRFASKVAVGIILEENGEATSLKRWFSQDQDVRLDPGISREIVKFIDQHQVKSVVMTDGIIGCPHEEGKDYPSGESCPQCPYWANRDRWTGELIGEEDQKASEKVAVAGCAWYRAEQWERLLEISADRDKLEATYEEWVVNALESLQKMRQAGMRVEKMDVDVEELLAWCRARGLQVDGKARSQYAAEMLRSGITEQSRKTGEDHG